MKGVNLLAWARFFRLANLPSALSGVYLGTALSASSGGPMTVLGLMISSAAIFSLGMGMNDLIDLEKDRRNRPGRPLPAGEIKPFAARVACAALGIIGLSCAAASGLDRLALALVLIGLISAYNFRYREGAVAGALLGLCRVVNFLLGLGLMSVDFRHLLPAAAYFLHVQLIMAVAAGEDAERPLKFTDLPFALLPALILPLFAYPTGLAAGALWLLLTLSFLHRASRGNRQLRIKTVGLLVCSLVLLDCLFLFSAGQTCAAMAWLLVYLLSNPALKRVPGG
ncbi:MAG: UbiA family prenyltransferase [Planctomycetes bacterium]|nr:UbiA family prenyltransferase [Planctomycetota bacterium]